MILLQEAKQVTDRALDEAFSRIHDLVERNQRFGALVFRPDTNESAVLAACRKRFRDQNGQYLFLDSRDFDEVSLPEILLSALETCHVDRPFRIHRSPNTPNHPKTSSPFMDRAIVWQRLCDRLIEDEDAVRPTLWALLHFDLNDPQYQHDFCRLVRFHQTHHIRRTFLLAISRDSFEYLDPEIREMIDLQIDV